MKEERQEDLEALIAAAFKPEPQPASAAAAKRLVQAFAAAGWQGRENGDAKALKGAALQTFKSAQAKLMEGGATAAAMPQLVSLAQASLGALEVLSPGAAAAPLLPLRYNFVKRLVAARAHEAAWQEAAVLYARLGPEAAEPPPRTADAANIAVGAVLMLLLCCVESPTVATVKLQLSLEAVQALEGWLRLLPKAEAEKHRDAIFKYLYKVATQLLERKEWAAVAPVAAAMAAVAASEAHQQRVVQALLKFAAHMPDCEAVEASGAAALALIGHWVQLPGAVALDAVGLLCAAYQRAVAPVAVSSLWDVLLECSASEDPVVLQAALLLPCLAMQQHGCSPGSWVQHAALATSSAAASAEALQQHEASGSLPPVDVQRHAQVLAASFQAGNLLRKALAGQGAAAWEALGGSKGAGAAAQQLELLASLVSTAATLSAAKQQGLPPSLASIAKQGHAAAMGLVTAAKLRAACAASQDQGPAVVSPDAVAALLGWDFGRYCMAGEELPSGGLLTGQELSWLVAALYNVGVDLYSDSLFEAAISPMLAAVSASICCLVEAVVEGGDQQAVAQRAQDVVKRCSALSDAQLKAGEAGAAITTLAHAVAALVQCGLGAPAWQDLLSSLARCRLDAVLAEQEHADVASGAPAVPDPNSRGAHKAKHQPPTGKVKAAAAAGSQASGGGVRLPALSCSRLLYSRYSEGIPAASLIAVAEAEMGSWAALAGSSSSVAGAECERLCSFLLEEAFPAKQWPAEHARMLLAIYQTGLTVQQQPGTHLLEQAVTILEGAEQDDTSAVAGRACGLLSLAAAQQLVEQSTLEQRQQRQQAHAAAEASSPNPTSSEARDSLPHNLNMGAWQAVIARMELTLQHLEAALSSAHQPLQLVDWEAAVQLVAELGCMAGLQGQGKLEARCRDLCLEMLSSLPCSPDSRLAQWAAITPAYSWLSFCLFPGLQPAVAQGVPGLAACLQTWPCSLAALYSSTRANQLDLAALRSCIQDLTSRPRHGIVGLQRACLHRLVAEREACEGNVVSALYHATEAHRLVFNATPATQVQAPLLGTSAAGAAPVGWWQLAAEQLCSMLQLGQIFELSGMADEALHALKEGLRMAVSLGSPMLAAAFRVQLADIFSKQGSPEARQALAPVSSLLGAAAGVHKPIVDYLLAQQLLVEAQLSVVASDYAAAWEQSQAAAALCSRAMAAAGEASRSFSSHVAAVHAWALLSSANCITGQGGDAKAATQLALQAAEMLAGSSAACGSGSSRGVEHRATALLFMALQEGRPSGSMQQGTAWVWGLQPCPAEGAPPLVETQPNSTRTAAAKKPTGRGGTRSKAKAAAEEPAAESSAALQPAHSSAAAVQQLWQVYWLTREVPHLHRLAAVHLAELCGKAGHAHLAVLLLHTSLGAIMRQQYRLVLHTKLQQCAGREAAAAAAGDAQQEALRAALSQLEEPLNGQLLRQLAGLEAPTAETQQQPRGRRRAPVAAEAKPASTQQEALIALDRQAKTALQRWLAVLPEGTVICSLSSHPSAGTLLPWSRDERLVVSRIEAGATPVVVQLPAPAPGAQGATRPHPIRALSLDLEAGAEAGGSSWVHPLAVEMLRLLEESGRSMRDMPTDTREQQREWWRARLALDDKLAELLNTMDSSWLSCWRCLLLGAVDGSGEQELEVVDSAVGQLQAHLAESGRPALSEQQLAAVRVMLDSLLQAGSLLSPSEFEEACGQLAGWLGLELPPEWAAALLQSASGAASSRGASSEPAVQPRSSRQGNKKAAAAAAARQGSAMAEEFEQPAGAASSSSSSNSSAAAAAAAPARSRRGGAAKTVTFQVEEGQEQLQQPAPRRAAARTQRSSSRATKGVTAAAVAEPGPNPAAQSVEGAACSPPPAAEGAVAAEGLCEDFGAMSLQQAADRPRALTTARASKHRSRLRMMQASTPGPAAGGSRALGEATPAAKAVVTAPRLRGGSAAVAADSAVGSGDAPNASCAPAVGPMRGPVLLVLDGVLQVLPWESVPGLRSQRIYRVPSLACAAASAQRSLREVDLSSTFYSLNPSGDLSSTQSAFQDWFARLRWKGKAGEPPTAAEMAEALQSHQLFVYFGHGGGEQYIPLGKLRSLDSCSAALLMGCSSGRLRLAGQYEPTGAVLAYLLAGCPAAVANLWDVTDKDIDRFSQALLNSWLEHGSGGGSSSSSGGGDGGVGTPSRVDISSAVASSRGSCKLPHLIGAAPVCYGLPTSVQ